MFLALAGECGTSRPSSVSARQTVSGMGKSASSAISLNILIIVCSNAYSAHPAWFMTLINESASTARLTDPTSMVPSAQPASCPHTSIRRCVDAQRVQWVAHSTQLLSNANVRMVNSLPGMPALIAIIPSTST